MILWNLKRHPAEAPRYGVCYFGLTETIVAAVGIEAGTAAATAATIGIDAAAGAALGATTSAAIGGNVGEGALFGGITGGAGGAIGALGAPGGSVAGAGGAIDATTGAAIDAGAGGASSLGAVAAPTTDIIGGADTIGAGAVDPATGAPLSSIAPGTSGAVSAPVSGAVAPGTNLAPSSGGIATPSASGDISSSAINAQVASPGATALDASAPTTNVGSLLNSPPSGGFTPDSSGLTPEGAAGTPPGPVSTGSLAPAGTGGVNAGADTGGLDLLPGDSEELASTNPAGTATVNDVLNPGGVPASSSGGFWNSVDKVISNPAFKLGAAVLPTAATLIRGQPAVPSQIQPLTSSGAVTAPLISAENTALGEASSGTLTPGQAATVGQYIQQSQDALYQQLANEGVTNPTSDSRYIAGMQQINQQAQIMTQNYITQAFTTGFQAAGQAAGALTTAANAQIQTDQEFQSALNSAMTSFGLIQGGGALASLAKGA